MLWQLLHHSDNHGNSLKKSFVEKDDFLINATGGPIGVEAVTFRVLVRLMYHLATSKAPTEQGLSDKYPGYC